MKRVTGERDCLLEIGENEPESGFGWSSVRITVSLHSGVYHGSKGPSSEIFGSHGDAHSIASQK